MAAYTVPSLPYSYDALEPFLDAHTVEVHHTQIHQNLVDNLNAALKGTQDLEALAEQPVSTLLQKFQRVPSEARTAVRNFGGGHANHTLFWAQLSDSGGGQPVGGLATAIDNEFGSFEAFKQRFGQVAAEHFGSGWVWLVVTRERLLVYAQHKEDSPFVTEEVPVLGLDVWEHAYFPHYETNRDAYVQAFWNVVNWDEINRRYEEGVTL